MKIFKYSFVILAVVSVSAYTMSDRQSTQFQVKMKVNEICDIGTGSTSNIDFGTISRNTQNIQATGSLNVSCTNGTPYNISLNPLGSQRRMKNSLGSYIQYSLYQDPSHSNIWQADTSYSITHQTIPVYAMLPSQSISSIGKYSDTITVTLTY